MHLLRFLILGALSINAMSGAVVIPATQNSTDLAQNSTLVARGRTRVPAPKSRTRTRRPVHKSKPKPRPVKKPVRRPVPAKKPRPVKRPVKKPVPAKRPATRPRPRPVKKPVTVKRPVRRPPGKKPPVTNKPKKPTTPPHPGKGAGSGIGTGAHNGTAATSCPVRKHKGAKSTNTKGKVARAVNSFLRLFRRNRPLFIGWHGTNSVTAAMWTKAGRITRPGAGDGSSGANHEIGDGLYVTDERFQAWVFARRNHDNQPHTDPAICAIFARDSIEFEAADKVWIPRNLVQDGTSVLASKKAKAIARERDEYIKRQTALGGAHNAVHEVILFSELAPGEANNQVMLPTVLGGDFYADCVTFNNGAVKTEAQMNALGFPPTGRQETPYSRLRRQWHILGAKNSKDLYVPPNGGSEEGCTIS